MLHDHLWLDGLNVLIRVLLGYGAVGVALFLVANIGQELKVSLKHCQVGNGASISEVEVNIYCTSRS